MVKVVRGGGRPASGNRSSRRKRDRDTWIERDRDGEEREAEKQRG